MPKSFNTQSKTILRKIWAKELLSFLNDKMEKKLFYLGLPSEEALDIKEWLEHLNTVYAFQCREYPNMSNELQSRDKVLELDNFLLNLERKKHLETFEVFDGYIEEVVLRGYDNSPTPKEFVHHDAVTVYNLDYCNSVTSPLEFVDLNQNVKKAYKFDALKKLMEMQANLNISSKKFVLFLTIHCSYNDAHTLSFQSNPPSEMTEYLNEVRNLAKGAKSYYVLKSFVYHNLSQFLLLNNFLPEFLPVVHYIGNGDMPLLLFTVLGTEVNARAGMPTSLQKTSDFLSGRFISVDNDNLINNEDLLAHEEIGWHNTNPVILFKDSKTYKTYWG